MIFKYRVHMHPGAKVNFTKNGFFVKQLPRILVKIVQLQFSNKLDLLGRSNNGYEDFSRSVDIYQFFLKVSADK